MILTLPKHITLTEVDNQMVLLDMQAGQYFGVNHTGANFLKFIQKNGDLELAINAVADLYKTEYEQTKDDINSLVTQLLEQKLLKNADE